MALQHKFTFPTQAEARNFVHRLTLAIQQKDLTTVAIFIDGNEVHVIDGDYQHERLIQLAKTSSATHMKAVRLPYPS